MIIVITIVAYFLVLLGLSWLTSKGASNEKFFKANRKSPWYMVAFGMIGASISGVTFVSVPGMVLNNNMSYLQMCLGFVLGYVVIAYVLLPIYYKLNLTSIYTYLEDRLGKYSYKTSASFFILSKMSSAAVKFYVVCMILQRFVLDQYHIPFFVTVSVLVLLIWLYTRKGGICTLVYTDSFQTLCMFIALLLIIYKVMGALDLSFIDAIHRITNDYHSQIFVFDDWLSGQNFWKQFLSGVFIVIVMTGLDQDMMQKNLTCKDLRSAQKDMCSYGLAFVPANLLFLSLGILLMFFYAQLHLIIPTATSDELMLKATAGGLLGTPVVVFFTIGIVAACFSSADSALTSLTTSYCVDIKNRADDEKLRKWVHFIMALCFIVFILLFRWANSTNLLDAIYTLVSYTYGPLLGFFAFGLFTKRVVNDKFSPFIAIASPLLCFFLDVSITNFTSYKFGYELLMLNGILTFLGLLSFSKNTRK
ncbi:sodium:solute symporter [Prevotella bivia]|jgi:hypothetical protein|uniref:Transporter, SSS family n=1 Tax=Prevotella bivia TaxID=28125 RepID=A0A137T055_9BACT|nr:sodium:solute symporter [Prevotella bivia]KXO18095.1 transporter, SSS family [Prevotella bivia]KXU59699.1 transporter, SSS family [Prevotella bivia]MDU5343472.1 sodium:solute symporter [Prevotella bivia]